MSFKLRLPNFKRIQISCISDADADLASFLSDCTPVRLKMLWVNYWANNITAIKSKFYVNAFLGAATRTTKEVYFGCIDFSAEVLQTVVRAARNAERIVFCFCWIHCSSGLDFGADLSYNTKFLSFQFWGDTSFKERTTDWKVDPSKFSLIVDAIGSSGLKTSLEKLSIAWNQSLSASKVQEELNAKGLSHIFVVEESVAPFSS